MARAIPNASFRSSRKGQILRTWRRDLRGITQREVASILHDLLSQTFIIGWTRLGEKSLTNHVGYWETGYKEIPDNMWNLLKTIPGFPIHVSE